jgi:transcriptional regulator with XRE-family HTH domain
MMTVNERVKEARVALNMKQIDFAKAIFVSNGYIAELEHGHRIVNERIIHLISIVLGINEEWLKSGEGAMFNKTPEQKLERIMSLFNELNPHFQDYALKQIDQLIELQKLTGGDE